MDLCNLSVIKSVMADAGITFRKEFGQNFLTNRIIPEEIAEQCADDPESMILEIGPGIGCLTAELASRYAKVVAVEIDKGLIPVLDRTLAEFDNVTVINADVMKLDLPALIEEHSEGRPVSVCANLPYYITTPLIMRFLESDLNVTSLTIMVQEEVGRRLVAKPNTADYSAITLAVLLRGEGTITRKVGRNMFYPAPNVDSAVVRIDVDKDKLAGENKALIHKLVRSAFLMRRKTLVNNLNASFGLSKAEAAEKLIAAGLDERVRGEALSLEDYVNLSHQF